jgi:hypothetical protein
MSATSNPSSLIYPAQGILTLTGRAWNLFRLNWKAGLLVMLGPTILKTGLAVLGSLLSSGTFLTPTTTGKLIFIALLGVTLMVGFLLYFFVWGFSCCTLSRFYYSAIIDEKPLSLKACWQSILKKAPALGLMMVIIIPLSGFMVILDIIFLYLGIFISAAALSAFAVSTHAFTNSISGITTIFFLLVWGFVVLALLIGLGTLQWFLCIFPFIAVATAPIRRQTTWPLVKQGIRQVFENLPRLIPYAVTLFIFTWVAMLTLMAPTILWVALEMKRTGMEHQVHLPFHISAIANLISGLVELMSAPFVISALTLFWYDCQVRREGIDLQLWFNKLLRRRNLLPQNYQTDLSFQGD